MYGNTADHTISSEPNSYYELNKKKFCCQLRAWTYITDSVYVMLTLTGCDVFEFNRRCNIHMMDIQFQSVNSFH